MAESDYDVSQFVNMPQITPQLAGWDDTVNDNFQQSIEAMAGGVVLLGRRVNIAVNDLANSGNVLFTVPDGWASIVHSVRMRGAAGSLSGDDYQFGFNAGSWDDWHSDVQVDALTGSSGCLIIAPEDWPWIGGSGDDPPLVPVGVGPTDFRVVRQVGTALAVTVEAMGSMFRV